MSALCSIYGYVFNLNNVSCVSSLFNKVENEYFFFVYVDSKRIRLEYDVYAFTEGFIASRDYKEVATQDREKLIGAMKDYWG
jgi:hypothetical protein